MKESVRKLVAEWDDMLHLAGRTYWKVEGITDPRSFFRELPKVFPHGRTLLIEGLEMGLSARALYEEFPATYTRKVACDTLDPTPESYHVAFRPEFAKRMCQLIDSQGLSTTCYHFKGYSENEVLFTFHDAFAGEFVLSSSLSEMAVRSFAGGLGLPVDRAEFPIDLREHLRAIDRTLNPPWWRRLLRVFDREKG